MLKLFIRNLLWITSLIFLTLGCGGSGGGDGSGGNGDTNATVSLACDTTDISYNESVTLNWSTTNAEACTASGAWSGDRATSGSETIESLTDNCTFILTCTDSDGRSAEDSVDITVTVNNLGTATLSWTPPTENTDGSDLTDLAGYKIYVGSAPGNYDSPPITITDNSIDTFLVEDLAEGTWYFAVSAFDTSGNESEKSNEGSKEITP